MALILSAPQKAALEAVDPYLEQALAEGVSDILGNQLVPPMPGYTNSRSAAYKPQIKAAFRATLAALIKSGIFPL